MACTDAMTAVVSSLDEAIWHINAYRDAGADIIYIEVVSIR